MTRHPVQLRVRLTFLALILATLAALGANYLLDQPPAHQHCTSYHTLSGESGTGCP